MAGDSPFTHSFTKRIQADTSETRKIKTRELHQDCSNSTEDMNKAFSYTLPTVPLMIVAYSGESISFWVPPWC